MPKLLSDEEYRGYISALKDLEELLDNSNENGGGIHYGELFIQRAHWDHEIRDLIEDLREGVE